MIWSTYHNLVHIFASQDWEHSLVESENGILSSVEIDGVVVMEPHNDEVAQTLGSLESVDMSEVEDVKSSIYVNNFVGGLRMAVVGELSESSSRG